MRIWAPARSTGVDAARTDGVYTDRIARAKRAGAAAEMALPVLQLVVGTLVAASAIVGYALHPSVAAVAALMGVGLLIAGVAGLLRVAQRRRAWG